MTLRELLTKVNLEEVYRLINKKDNSYIAECDRPSMEITVKSYSAVVKELLSKPSVPEYEMPMVLQKTKDPFNKSEYVEALFLNLKYEAPTKGLKPWFGDGIKKSPKGHYDANDNKHNYRFAMGFMPWSKIIDTTVINKTEYSLEIITAELLWELTFYGWSEKKSTTSIKELEKRFKEVNKEIKDKKYTKLSKKSKNGFDVIIPNSVTEQIKNISKKYETGN